MCAYNSGDPSGTYLEGISDEVIYIITIIIISISTVITLCYRNRTRHYQQRIHPAYEDVIDETRRSVLTSQREATNESHNTAASSHSKGLPDRTNLEPSAPPSSSRNTSGEIRYFDSNNSDCPICFNPARNAVETNCGHLFCAQCIVTYWNHASSPLYSVPCPVCRRQVNLLLPIHLDEPLSDEETLERIDLLAQINTYNRRFSGEPRPWYDYVRDAPIFLRHLWDNMFTIRGLDWIYQIRIAFLVLLLVLYIISPLDLIPEGVFGLIGIFDDLMVLFIFCIYIAMFYRYLVTQNGWEWD